MCVYSEEGKFNFQECFSKFIELFCKLGFRNQMFLLIDWQDLLNLDFENTTLKD